MKVNIDKLSEKISQLLSKLKEEKGNEIELNNNLYWVIPKEELYNIEQEPTDFLLGSIDIDWYGIENGIRGNNSIPSDLQKVSNIINALSIENPTSFYPPLVGIYYLRPQRPGICNPT